jgi:hypothetical protein
VGKVITSRKGAREFRDRRRRLLASWARDFVRITLTKHTLARNGGKAAVAVRSAAMPDDDRY